MSDTGEDIGFVPEAASDSDIGFTPETDEARYEREHPVESYVKAAMGGLSRPTEAAWHAVAGGLHTLSRELSPSTVGDVTNPTIDQEKADVAASNAEHEAAFGAAERAHPLVSRIAQETTKAAAGVLTGEAAGGLVAGAGRVAPAIAAGSEALDGAGLAASAADFVPQVTKFAVQGAASALPSAASDAFNGDYKRAAEALAIGGGLGGVAGLLGTLGETAARSWAGSAGNNIERLSARLAGASDELAEGVGSLASKGAKNSLALGAAAPLHLVPGVGQALYGLGVLAARKAPQVASVAEGAGNVAKGFVKQFLSGLPDGTEAAVTALRNVAADPIGSGLGGMLAYHAESAVAQALARIPDAVLDKEPAKKAPSPPAETDNEWKDYAEQLTRLATNPLALLDRTSPIADAITHDPSTQRVATAFQAKTFQSVQWLYTQLPKPPPPQPFQKADAWQPTVAQKAKFIMQREVVANPLSVIDSLNAGTLQQAQVDALAATSPEIHRAIQKVVFEMSTAPPKDQPSRARLAQLGMLAGFNLDPLSEPGVMQQLQSMFQQSSQQRQAGPGGKPSKGRPASFKLANDGSTQAQRAEHGDIGGE
jgi:hypothetical protein